MPDQREKEQEAYNRKLVKLKIGYLLRKESKMCLTHPDILKAERDGMPEDKLCHCGAVISDDARFCEDCWNEYQNQRDDEAEDDRLFNN